MGDALDRNLAIHGNSWDERPVVSAGTAPVEKMTVNMTEFQFTPKTLALKPRTTVELTLVNKGSVPCAACPGVARSSGTDTIGR